MGCATSYYTKNNVHAMLYQAEMVEVQIFFDLGIVHIPICTECKKYLPTIAINHYD